MRNFAIVTEKIELQTLIDLVSNRIAGAICTFIGTVRELTEGKRTLYLEYQAIKKWQRKLKQIGDEIVEQYPTAQVAIVSPYRTAGNF